MRKTSRHRRDVEWRQEHGPGYDLRQYQRGRPTGLVAVLGWHHNEPTGLRQASGPDVRLWRDHAWILVEEHDRGRPGAGLRLPVRSIVDARIDEEPGLPGVALLRLTLTARFGHGGVFTVPLWFSAECRLFLRGLVEEVLQQQRLPPRPEVTRRAPSGPDWIVFRSASDATAGTER